MVKSTRSKLVVYFFYNLVINLFFKDLNLTCWTHYSTRPQPPPRPPASSQTRALARSSRQPAAVYGTAHTTVVQPSTGQLPAAGQITILVCSLVIFHKKVKKKTIKKHVSKKVSETTNFSSNNMSRGKINRNNENLNLKEMSV